MLKIAMWWYNLQFLDSGDCLRGAWESVTTRGGWSLILARQFNGRVVIWQENRKYRCGVLLDGMLHQPKAPSELAESFKHTFLYILSPEKCSGFDLHMVGNHTCNTL